MLTRFLARQAEGSVVSCRKPQYVSLVIFFFFKHAVPEKHDRICFTSLLPGSNPSGFVRSMVCNNCTHPRWLLKTLWNAICQACVQQAACHSARRKEEAESPPQPFPSSHHWMEPGHIGGEPRRVAQRITGSKPPASLQSGKVLSGNKPWRFCGQRLTRPLLPSPAAQRPSKHIYLQGEMVSASFIFPLKCSIFEVIIIANPFRKLRPKGDCCL